MNTYTQKMGQAEAATRRADQANRQIAGSFDGLKSAIAGTIAVLGVQQIVSMTGELNALGVQVRANRTLFGELTDEIGGHEQVLASLRESTGGVVDDMTLMAGASQLLRLNIVDNNRDLNELYGNIQKLKQPTESTTDAIHNFALMLSNESLLRLDSFGISSANVKRRMDELGQSFREAVMAEMDVQVERLGAAANVAETALGRLQTRLENFKQGVAEDFAASVEATLADIERRVAALEKTLDEEERISALIQAAGGQPTVIPATGFMHDVYGVGGLRDTENDLRPAALGFIQLQDRIRAGWRMAGSALQDYLDRARQAEAQTKSALAQQQQFNALLGFSDDFSASPERYFDQSIAQLESGLSRLQQMRGGMAGDTMLFTPEEAAQAQDMVRYVDALQGKLDLLEGTDLIPEGVAERAKELADAAGTFADQAEKGAKAFLNLSLDQVFGTDSPDRMLGEMDTMLLDAARSAGLAADEVERLQDALDRSAGRETDFSEGVEDFLGQMVSSGMSVEQIAESRQKFAEVMRRAMEQGLDMSSIRQAGNIPYLFGMAGGGPGQEIVVNPGDSPWSLSRKYNLPQDSFNQFFNERGTLLPGTYQLGGMGQFNPDFNPDEALRVFEDMQGISSDMVVDLDAGGQTIEEMRGSADGINSAFIGIDALLTAMFSKKYVLQLDAIAPDWLKALLQGGGIDFAAAMAAATQANGGTPPGVQPVGRSTRVVDR